MTKEQKLAMIHELERKAHRHMNMANEYALNRDPISKMRAEYEGGCEKTCRNVIEMLMAV